MHSFDEVAPAAPRPHKVIAMRISTLALAVGVIIAGLLPAALQADVYLVSANVPVQISPPVQPSETLQVFIKAKGGEWQTPDYVVRDGRVIISPDPKKLGGSEMILVINPPADLNLNDSNPPIILGIKVDGAAHRASTALELGRLSDAPGVILWGIADRENALDLNTLRVTLNDRQIAPDALAVDVVGKRQVGVIADMGDIDYGKHEVTIRIADVIPGANRLEARIGFELVDTGNLIQLVRDKVVVKTDSCFSSYPNLEPLIDGFKMLDGSGAGNDVTWASAEMGGPHWIEVTLPEPKPMKEVTVYWAFSGQTFYTSQRVEVQVPDNGGWRTIATSGDQPLQPQRNHTLRFDEVTTDRFRVYQPDKGGPAARPDLMWVAEVEAR